MAGVYRVNFRSQAYRPSRGPNSLKFGAADDTAAGNIATELANWTSGQRTSLQLNVMFDNGLPYPPGTRFTVKALAQDASFGVHTVRFRNLDGAATSQNISNLLTGTADVTAPISPIVALSDPPAIPGGNPIASVSGVNIVAKF